MPDTLAEHVEEVARRVADLLDASALDLGFVVLEASTGSYAWTEEVDGQPVSFISAERFPGGSVGTCLIAHEAAHAVHHRVRAGSWEPLAMTKLFEEAIAVAVSREMRRLVARDARGAPERRRGPLPGAVRPSRATAGRCAPSGAVRLCSSSAHRARVVRCHVAGATRSPRCPNGGEARCRRDLGGRSRHLVPSARRAHHASVRIRRSSKEQRLEEIAEVLHGCGRMLQSIDARLEEAVYLLGGGEDEEEDQP